MYLENYSEVDYVPMAIKNLFAIAVYDSRESLG